MGTVVLITLLLITRFHVSKMDADTEERRRDRISRREKRWSMNSQRLEQIVAELMRPIGDLRRSFDTDLSALLEEYLTEAGLHALEAEGGSPGSSRSGGAAAGAGGLPNFPELALLLQQSANIYGRKVDFLYQHVLEVSESLQNSTNELSQSALEGASPARRKRRASGALGAGAGAGAGGGWARIALQGGAGAGARREAGAGLRPPPTLPRMYAELEPRVLAAADAPLTDYAGEPIGLLQDFHVTWRLQAGLLLDDLQPGGAGGGGAGVGAGALRAIPLQELQAAIAAAAPPEPPPAPAPDPDPDPFDDARLVASTPLPLHKEEPEPPPPQKPAKEESAPALRRKRKTDNGLYEQGAGKIFITAELAEFLRERREFSVREEWVARVVGERRAQLLGARRRLRLEPALAEFRGFDEVDKFDLVDIGGFLGWGAAPPVSERLLRLARLAGLAGGDSDDDGFFEASDHGSDADRLDSKSLPSLPTPPPTGAAAADAEAEAPWAGWRADVLARAAAGEARGLDVRALGRAVLAALPDAPDAPAAARATPFEAVLHRAASDEADVSRLFLATLFLANAGNVEVVGGGGAAGAAGAPAAFALRVASRDERRYCAAAQQDPAFLTR